MNAINSILIRTQVANNLKVYRKAHNISQEALASKLFVTRTALGSYEEQRAMPHAELLLRICKEIGCSVEQFLTGDINREVA